MPHLLHDVARARGALRTLRARFTQRRRLALFATDITSSGELALVRPDRLRWELLPPDAVTYWVGPSGLAFRAGASAGSVSRETAGVLGAVLADLLVVLGGDVRTLAHRYRLRGERDERGAGRISAEPLDAAVRKAVRRLHVVLEPDLVTPREVILEESDADRVQITFRDVRRDQPIDAGWMLPPDGLASGRD
jgi:hypothetical protein